MKLKKRITALLIAGAMVCSTLPVNVLAVENSNQHTSNLCEHHTEHNADCGYSEGTPGTPCNHEHTDECYTLVTECVHEHTEDCYPAEGVSDNTATPSEPDKAEPTECTHECNEESGCITKVLNCQHEHDSECGYTEAVRNPCTFVCEECTAETGEQEDKCICGALCTEDTANTDCPVCGADGADLSICKGTPEQEKAECICTALCIEGVVNTDCPICGALGADLTQCTGKKADEQVKAVQELIDELPTADELAAMSLEQQQAIYAKLQAAYEAYNALTDEQKAKVTGAEIFDSLFAVFASMTNTMTKEAEEQFPSLTPGETYWFDLSDVGIPGTVNTGNEWGAVSVPDATLTWVPFTYVGTVNTYVLNENSRDQGSASQSASQTTESSGQYGYTYDHSLFIADYNLTHTVSWDNLNAADKNMIFGTDYTSGGVEYTLRTPTAGSTSNGGDTDDWDERGIPENNEWDAILNKANQDYQDNTDGYIKNWYGMYSLGQDSTITSSGQDRPSRGYITTRYWNWYESYDRFDNIGFRPVLELPGADTLTSDDLQVVEVDLNGGSIGSTAGTINLVVKSGENFTAPGYDGLTRPKENNVNYFAWLGSDGKTYLPDASVSAEVTKLTAQWKYPSEVEVKIDPSEAVYGSTVTITAEISKKENALTRAAEQNKVDFYLGTVDSGIFLDSADVRDNTATLQVSLNDEKWTAGQHTITAEYGGSMTLKSESGTATLNVTKAGQNGSPDVSVSETTVDSITVSASGSDQGGYEYACVKGENASAPTAGWQNSNTFSSREPGTAYTVFARYAGNDYYNPSDASEGTTIYTLPEITTANLADGYVGVYYTAALAAKKADDVDVSWSLVGDTSLPDGLTLSKDGTISGKPTAPSDAPVTFTVQATINGNVSNTKKLSITVNKGTPDFGTLAVSGYSGEGGAFVYGDTITISGTIQASSTPPITNALTAPVADEAALFQDDKQLTEPVAVAEDGSFAIQYDTSDKGIMPDADPQTLTVKYGGSDNLTTGEKTTSITLLPKPLTAAITGTTTKVYDGTTNAPEDLSITLSGVVGEDDVTAAATFAYDGKDVGDQTITASNITLGGADHGNYKLSSTTATADGSITESGSTLSATAEKADLTYGDTLSITVTPSTTGQAPAANAIRADGKQGVELFYEGASLATAETPNAGGTYTLTYDTGNKTIPIGNELSLTVQFYGDSNMAASKTTVSGIHLSKKPVNASLNGKVSKSYDNETDVLVAFEVTEGLEAGDNITGTAVGTFADANVGENKPVAVEAEKVIWSEDAQWYEIALPSEITGSILQAGTDAKMETYLDGQQAAAFEYGDTITVKATLTAKEEKQDQGILKLLGIFTEPAENQAALYVRTDEGDTQLTEPQEVTSGQELTFTYVTTDKGLSIGNNTLVVKYVGDKNMKGTETPEKVIALGQKQITPHVKGTAEKTYDGSTAVENGDLNLFLAGVETGDTVSATASFAYADKNVGMDKTIHVTGITLQGKDKDYYKLEETSLTTTGAIRKASAPTITYPKAGSLTYGQTLSESALTGGSEEYGTFGWQSPDTVPTVQNSGYTVVFTPSEATIQNYEAISDTEQTVMVTVEKATPELTLTPSAGSLTGGGSVTLTVAGLPDGGRLEVTCSDGNIKPQTDENNIWTVTLPNSSQTYTFTANYTGDDNHNAVEASCQVVVSKKSSGGGSSSGSDSTIIDRPDKDNPTTPTTAETKTVKADDKGNVVITKSMVSDAISVAQADARKNGNTANGIAVVVPVEISKTLNGVQITLKADALDKLVSSGVKRFTIDTDRMTDFGFTLDTLKKLNHQTSGDIVLKVKKTTVSFQEAKAAIGNRPVYDISLWEVKGGKETKLTDMTGVKISIVIPYTPAKNEQIGNLYAVYVDGNGKVQWITKSSYDADQKAVIFEAIQMGVYGVGCDKRLPAFTDIGSHWAREHILFTVSRGLFSGTSSTTFSPNTTLTRGMFVTVLGRLAGINPDSYKTGTFIDVKADAYYAPYVNWAASKGIVSGTTSTTFAPDSKITREQMAVIMKNYADKMGYSIPKTLEVVTFADNASISSWAKEAVKAMQQAGILSGKSNNQFDPKGNATRAEAATVLHRFVEVIIDPQTANGWVQNDSGEWSYYKNGEPVKGWLSDDQKWYWLDKNTGKMFAGGWKQIDGKQYYFYAGGSMAVSTKVDGYEVGMDGARKNDYPSCRKISNATKLLYTLDLTYCSYK